MTIEIRRATPEDMQQFGSLTEYVYAGAYGFGEDNLTTQANQPEWLLCAFDGSKLVASYGTIPFTMRANGNAMALGGVTTVGTLPEYRRRGLQRTLTEKAFAQQHEAGAAVTALWASQAAIYQRYGYCAGSVQGNYSIDTVDINLLQPPDPGLSVTRCSLADGFEDIRQIYREFVSNRFLYLHRSKPLWNNNTLNTDQNSGPVHTAICRNSAGEGVGYVVYTLNSNKVTHRARAQEIEIRDLTWLDIDVCRALWAFLARHDLVGRVVWHKVPLDDPTPELLMEPRLLHAQHTEGVWFRVVDVARALTERGYCADGEIVLGVTADRLSPWNEGAYHLSVADGVAEVTKTSRTAEITFPIKSLASAFCGYRRVAQLAHWGLLDGEASATARADSLFATIQAPHCPDNF
jgi:predicted acetyltransferase